MNPETANLAALAIRLEERGERFYANAAKSAPSAGIRDIFLRLAEEERQHAATFRKILTPVEPPAAIDEKGLGYLRALFDNGLFTGKGDSEPPADPRAALAIGIQAEKDSILLYQEMFDGAATPEEREVLSKLLKHEKFHLMELRDTLDGIG